MSTNNNMEENDNLVIIDYEDLLPTNKNSNDDSKKRATLHHLLSKAFGGSTSSSPSSNNSNSNTDNKNNPPLGLIVIRNVPNFTKTKESFLPLAHKLATLPSSYLEQNLTDITSMYNVGWSHGKEKLKNNEPDLSKGSFYFNPIIDIPGTEQERELFPCSYPINKWPSDLIIPQFEILGKELGCLMKDVVALLAYHIDDYVKTCCHSNTHGSTHESTHQNTSENKYAYNVSMGAEMKHTEKVKGRLLYYFPQNKQDTSKTFNNASHDHNTNENDNNNDNKTNGNEKDNDNDSNDNNDNNAIDFDSWIGWHNDSGFLTALAGDIYVDHDTGERISTQDIDPKAGLYIQDRNGSIKQIRIPNDCMAIQIGECLQIVTGGHVAATPHCVRGVDPNWCNRRNSQSNQKVARISFPCFVDTGPSFPLSVPFGYSRDDVLKSGVVGCAKVPPLEDRWMHDGMDFGSFLQKTFALYYDWSK